jgi:hypothetical protein
MGDLDKELHEEMLIELYKSLDNFMIAIAIDHMPENFLGTFRKMVDQERPNDEIEQFVIEHVPNAEEVFANADTLFREYYLGKGA